MELVQDCVEQWASVKAVLNVQDLLPVLLIFMYTILMISH